MLYSLSRQNNISTINPAFAGFIDARIFIGIFDADAGHFIDIKTHRRE